MRKRSRIIVTPHVDPTLMSGICAMWIKAKSERAVARVACLNPFGGPIMLTESSGIVKVILSVLFFPMYFQESFVSFAWGAGDQLWLMSAKRVFLLLPAMAD